MTIPTPTTTRRWRLLSLLRPRFSLRLMLALLTICCIWLAVHTQRAERQRQAVRLHEVNSSTVYYDYMRTTDKQWINNAVIEGNNPHMDPRKRSHVPACLLNPLGPDFFHSVLEINIRDCDQLHDLAGFPRLQSVWTTGNSIQDRDIQQVVKRSSLQRLEVSGNFDYFNQKPSSELTDRSLELLAQMPKLQTLTVSGRFTAEGLAALAKSRSLQRVSVVGCDDSVTPAVAELFRASGKVQQLSLRKWPPQISALRLFGSAAPTATTPDDGLIAEW